MKHLLTLLLLAVFYPLIAYCEQPAPVIAVFIESSGLAAPGADSGSRFLTAVWPDGRIIWSRDKKAGGAPYLTAMIEPARVEELLQQFVELEVFKKRGTRQSWFGPDSSHHSIWLHSGKHHTQLATWHELFEENPNLVVINGSVTSLDGRKREEVIRADTKEFRDFRKLWSDLRSAISALIPPAGKEYSGAMNFKLPR